MFPSLAPPVWPEEPPRKGRFAAAIVRSAPDLVEDADALAQAAKCRVALLGMPDDSGVRLNGGRPGARAGPTAIRAALARYGVASPADEPAAAHAYPRVFDAGDVIPGATLDETHDRVSEAVAGLVAKGFFPIGLGGGHDLTFAFVRGVSRAHAAPLTGAYIDAHLDVRAEPGSGMPFRALLEGGFAHRLTCIGLNPLANTREHMEYFASRGGAALNAGNQVTPEAWACALGAGNPSPAPAFLSLDMDAFDAACAPGVSALNPCGLLPREVEWMVRAAGRSPGVRCFDIMELNPEHDEGGRTARLAAHMLLTFLRGFEERAGSAPGASR